MFKNLHNKVDETIPSKYESKNNAEYTTPYKLRCEMIDKIPDDFWKTPKKVLEPCCGKGGFVISIIEKFSKYLDMKTIIEDCLYFSDINEDNVNFVIDLLKTEYKLNYNIGNTLDLDIKEKWDLDGFDAVIGNPPYNIPKQSKLKGGYGGRSLWDKFVDDAIDKWLIKNGYLLYVHPPSWRKPEHRLWDKMTKQNKIIYLKCFTENEGIKLFNCGVIVDYYLLQKKNNSVMTKIFGQDKKTYQVNLNNWNFLPSGQIDIIQKILGKNEVIYSRSLYGTDKKNILPTKKKEPKKEYYERCKKEKYTYPIIHNMTKAYGNGYVYSNKNKGHFGIKKVILSFGRHQYPYNDYEGKYGMSQICYGLQIDNKEEGENICKAVNSDRFKTILKYTKWSTFQTDWRMFKYFKKDFWKEFI
jgi:hypothetical protein